MCRTNIFIIVTVFCVHLCVCASAEDSSALKTQPDTGDKHKGVSGGESGSEKKAETITITRSGGESGEEIVIRIEEHAPTPMTSVQQSPQKDPPATSLPNTSIENGNSSEYVYPQPPKDALATSSGIVLYYCKCWINEDYKAMYGSLNSATQAKIPFEQFCDRFVNDKQRTSGLVGAKILNAGKPTGNTTLHGIELIFRNQRVHPRDITAKTEKNADGFRIIESGLLPIALGDL